MNLNLSLVLAFATLSALSLGCSHMEPAHRADQEAPKSNFASGRNPSSVTLAPFYDRDDNFEREKRALENCKKGIEGYQKDMTNPNLQGSWDHDQCREVWAKTIRDRSSPLQSFYKDDNSNGQREFSADEFRKLNESGANVSCMQYRSVTDSTGDISQNYLEALRVQARFDRAPATTGKSGMTDQTGILFLGFGDIRGGNQTELQAAMEFQTKGSPAKDRATSIRVQTDTGTTIFPHLVPQKNGNPAQVKTEAKVELSHLKGKSNELWIKVTEKLIANPGPNETKSEQYALLRCRVQSL